MGVGPHRSVAREGISTLCLTSHALRVYAFPVTSPGVTGFGSPTYERTTALTRSVFTVPSQWRASWGVFGRAGSSYPVCQPVASAAFSFGSDQAADSHNQYEDSAMDQSLTCALRDHQDTLECTQWRLRELSCLFQVIEKLAAPDSHARELAAIGTYLAEDWRNTLDCTLSELKETCDA